MRKLLFIVLVLCLSSPVFGAVTDSTKTAANNDDSYLEAPFKATGWASSNTTNGRKIIKVGNNSAGYAFLGYFRLPIPTGIQSGATINSATLNLTCLGALRASATNLKISVFDSLDAYQASSAATFNLLWAKRDSVTTPIDWDIASTDTLVRYSKDVTILVQRVVDLGAVGGKNIGLFVSADSTITYRDFGVGTYEEGVANYMPTLVVTYTNPSTDAIRERGLQHPVNDISDGRVW